jgi:hydroxypyruvate isomerase
MTSMRWTDLGSDGPSQRATFGFSAHVSWLFAGLPFLDRFREAAAVGFTAVEFGWPSPFEMGTLSASDLASILTSLGLTANLINVPGTVLGESSRVFTREAHEAVRFARALDCGLLNVAVGRGDRTDSSTSLLCSRLAQIADSAAPHGITILVEAINAIDEPDWMVTTSGEAIGLIECVGRPNIRFLLDTFHLGRAGENLPDAVLRTRGVLGHVQLGDVPGRHEPGSGNLPFGDIVDALATVGYQGRLGLEFAPAVEGAPEFGFLPRLGKRLNPPPSAREGGPGVALQ